MLDKAVAELKTNEASALAKFNKGDDDELCFACETFHSFTTAIKEDTDLSNEDVLDLASELSGMILSAIVVRLQSDWRSLLKDLLQTMERREKPN
jgi:hypothetical protein